LVASATQPSLPIRSAQPLLFGFDKRWLDAARNSSNKWIDNPVIAWNTFAYRLR
jgi:hypothetical protein